MKILSMIHPQPGIEINGGMYTTLELLINGRPPDPSYTFAVGENEFILVVLAQNQDVIDQCNVTADWLEEQGCPQEWTDKLRRFNQDHIF